MVDLEVRHTEQYGRGLYTRGKISCGMEARVVTGVWSSHEIILVVVRVAREHGTVESTVRETTGCNTKQNARELQPSSHTFQLQPSSHTFQQTRCGLLSELFKRIAGRTWNPYVQAVKDSLGVIAKEQVAEQLLGVKALLREDFDGGHAYDVLCKLICNTFSICDGEMVAIGAGVYIQCSQLNHSCDPNCVALFAGKTLTVRAIKDIPAGDQMLISYVDLVDSCLDRRSQLKKVYGFVCVCVRCLVEEREDKETAEVMKELEYRKSLKATRDWKGIVGCHQLSPHCTVVTAIRESELMCEAQLELGMWKHAANTASTLVDLYRRWLFQYHPLIGLTLMKLGKLQRVEGTMQQLKASITPLTQAVHCLGVSHGPTHPLTREAQEMLMDSDSELMNRSSVPLADNH
ncbi:hypothetical protein EMCRGX_G021240 [Ephydatia muelleri]